MKDKLKAILSAAKGIKPSYLIQYTVMDGDAMAELRPDKEVIAKYEKDVIDEEKAVIFRAYRERETEKDKMYLNNKENLK